MSVSSSSIPTLSSRSSCKTPLRQKGLGASRVVCQVNSGRRWTPLMRSNHQPIGTGRNSPGPLINDRKYSGNVGISRTSKTIRLRNPTKISTSSISFEGSDDEVSAAAAAGSTEGSGSEDVSLVGAVVLIAGTTIGGGTLALPASAAPLGFLPTAAALVGVWLFLFLEAVLLVEVTVRMKAEGSAIPGEPVSFEQMADRTLGKVGGMLTGLVYQFYSYASILAYVAGVGGVVSQLLGGAVNAVQGQVLTVFGIWGVIILAGKKGIEVFNEKANYLFFALMASIIAVGLTKVNPGVMMSHSCWSAAPAAAGILLFNVVFHDIIPLVCESMNYNIKKINMAFFLGGAVPLFCYLCWIAVALGSSGASVGGVMTVDPVQAMMATNSIAGKVVQLWAFLAICTSFIGCGMAQAEYEASLMRQFADPLLKNIQSAGSSWMAKLKSLWYSAGFVDLLSYAVVLLPPLAISLACPDLFFKAADLAGVYGVAVLYGVLPPLMAGVLRKVQAKDEKLESEKMNSTPGGVITLALLFAVGMSIAIRETLTYF